MNSSVKKEKLSTNTVPYNRWSKDIYPKQTNLIKEDNLLRRHVTCYDTMNTSGSPSCLSSKSLQT